MTALFHHFIDVFENEYKSAVSLLVSDPSDPSKQHFGDGIYTSLFAR